MGRGGQGILVALSQRSYVPKDNLERPILLRQLPKRWVSQPCHTTPSSANPNSLHHARLASVKVMYILKENLGCF